MLNNFDDCPDRRETESVKWNHYQDGVIPMWVADMDFVSPEPVVQAVVERARHGVYGYPQEIDGLRDAIVGWLADHYHWQIDPQEIVFFPGVVTGFNMACRALAAAGGEVVVQTPVYPPMLTAAAYAGMQRRDALLQQDTGGSYSIDWESYANAFSPQTRLFLLCNPHNPVGRVFTPIELERMAETCLEQKVVICSDEIHCDLLYRGQRHVPIAALNPEIARHTITLMAPSKTFNIAGFECSFAVIPDPELRRSFQHAADGLVSGVNLMGWVAALAAYQHGQPWLDCLLATLEENRDYLYDFVQAELPGIRMGKPQATYLAWLDCREAGLEGGPYEFFLNHARVALNDGMAFGPGGEGFVRLNFGCSHAQLALALERMKAALRARQ